MAEYRLNSSISQEAIDEAARDIVDRRDAPILVNPEHVRVTFSDDAVRAIVREELAAFKAEIVKQVMSDIAKELRLQQGSGRE